MTGEAKVFQIQIQFASREIAAIRHVGTAIFQELRKNLMFT